MLSHLKSKLMTHQGTLLNLEMLSHLKTLIIAGSLIDIKIADAALLLLEKCAGDNNISFFSSSDLEMIESCPKQQNSKFLCILRR